MYFVVLGAGEVGVRIAQVLSNEGHEVVLIEKEKTRVSRIYNRIDCRLIVDEGTRVDVLNDADIARADYFIAVTNSDEINLITCILAQQLSPKIKNIARLRNQEYMQNVQEIESVFPVHYVVNPEREAALSIIRSIEYGGGTSEVFTFKNFGNIMMRNYFVDSNSEITGKAIKKISEDLSIPSHLNTKFLIALVNRKDEAIIPTGDFVIQEGDEIFVLGHQEELEELFTSYLGKKVKAAKHIKKIIIIGASPVADHILDCYYNTRESRISSIIGKKRFATRNITVIDENLSLCEEFADRYQDINVLHADINEEDILEDLEINQADMIIATTSSQERNIVLAAHSHHSGVELTIALVKTPVYFNVAAELGISISLSVRSAVVSSILRFIRGQTSLYSLVESSYGIFQCVVSSSSTVVYNTINNITLPPKCLILCSTSEKGTFISHGNSIVQPNDKLLCIAHPEYIDRLHKIFAGKNTIEENNQKIKSKSASSSKGKK